MRRVTFPQMESRPAGAFIDFCGGISPVQARPEALEGVGAGQIGSGV